jgi:hypothetical protein
VSKLSWDSLLQKILEIGFKASISGITIESAFIIKC